LAETSYLREDLGEVFFCFDENIEEKGCCLEDNKGKTEQFFATSSQIANFGSGKNPKKISFIL